MYNTEGVAQFAREFQKKQETFQELSMKLSKIVFQPYKAFVGRLEAADVALRRACLGVSDSSMSAFTRAIQQNASLSRIVQQRLSEIKKQQKAPGKDLTAVNQQMISFPLGD